MSTRPVGWLRGVISRADQTQTYVFEDEQAAVATDLPLQEWARRCQLAHADVEIAKACLIEMQNQLVQGQAALAKAELLLERQQDGFRLAAEKLPGVPCLK